MSTTMMACGHAANASDAEGNPVCVICHGDPKSRTVVESPSLAGRTARCTYYGRPIRHGIVRGSCECEECRGRKTPDHKERSHCRCERPSSVDLAFFSYRGPGTSHYAKEAPHDEFYCGCFGWD